MMEYPDNPSELFFNNFFLDIFRLDKSFEEWQELSFLVMIMRPCDERAGSEFSFLWSLKKLLIGWGLLL